MSSLCASRIRRLRPFTDFASPNPALLEKSILIVEAEHLGADDPAKKELKNIAE